MLIVLAFATAYGGWRVVHAAWASLRHMPRSNDDLVFW